MPARDLRRIRDKIALLPQNPRPPGIKKLKGTDDLYRLRVGDWRVVFTIDDAERIVRITNVERKEKDTYR